jgi:Tfp pilus assembly protein PilX
MALSMRPMQHQRGAVMFVALVVLVLMTLAGLAMLRQMGGGMSIAGNLAFKQSATAVADLGTEAGRAWIMDPANAALLKSDSTANGYYSSWKTGVDSMDMAEPSKFAWVAAPSLNDTATGSTVRYLVHRLCEVPDLDANDPAQRCSARSTSGGSKGGASPAAFPGATQPYFRITTRVDGPRNTVSYIQVITE